MIAMEEGRVKIDGMSFLTSLLINVIVFTLAFVYVAHAPTGTLGNDVTGTLGENVGPPGINDYIFDETTQPNVDMLEIPPPADFVGGGFGEAPGKTEGTSTGQPAIDLPQFQWIYDSNFLQSQYRGKVYWVCLDLNLDASGNLTSEPKLVTSSGESFVDTETISRIKKTKFTPAKNKETGEAVASKSRIWVVWNPGG